jgi:hypothetical protein
MGGPCPPPPPPGMGAPPPPSAGAFPGVPKSLIKPPNLERAPRKPMKKFNWVKLPDRELNQNTSSLWFKLQGATPKLKVNFDTLEDQFSQRQLEAKTSDTALADKKSLKVA